MTLHLRRWMVGRTGQPAWGPEESGCPEVPETGVSQIVCYCTGRQNDQSFWNYSVYRSTFQLMYLWTLKCDWYLFRAVTVKYMRLHIYCFWGWTEAADNSSFGSAALFPKLKHSHLEGRGKFVSLRKQTGLTYQRMLNYTTYTRPLPKITGAVINCYEEEASPDSWAVSQLCWEL